MRILAVIFLAVAVAAVPCGIATATDFTFEATTGNWHVAGNWNPSGGPPGANDTATIPNGKTCTVASGNAAAAEEVTVNNGGTLEVKDDLDVGENFTGQGSALTVDSGATMKVIGTGDLNLHADVTLNDDIDLVGVSNNWGDIFIMADLTISGTGTISGRGDINGTGTTLTLASGVTLKDWGRVTMTNGGLVNNGQVVKDSAAFDSTLRRGELSGSGTWKILAGTVRGDFANDPVFKGTNGTWIIDGSTAVWRFEGVTDTCFSDKLEFIRGKFEMGDSDGFSHCGEFEFGGHETDDMVFDLGAGETPRFSVSCALSCN